MDPTAYFHSFVPIVFGTTISQKETIRWAMQALERCSENACPDGVKSALELYHQFLKLDSIESRVTCLADYTHQNWDEMQLFNKGNANWFKPPLEKRMALFRKEAMALVTCAFEKDETPPDYLVQVSCTGYDSPHATQQLGALKKWGDRSHLLHVGHMGCYAALPVSAMSGTLLQGKRVLKGGNPKASLIFIELCTLHFDPSRYDAQQVVMNLLFADGAIRFDVSLDRKGPALALLGYAEEILPDTKDEMTWTLRDSSFGMTLSRVVPVLLKRTAPGFLDRLLKPHGLSIRDIDCFAIHPGGPRIIDYLSQAFELTSAQIRHSREVLRTRGNMSSCTVPHIWEQILNDPSVPSNALIVSLAFGPGLTIAGNLMRKEI